MNNVTICENRLKNIILADKQENPARIERVVRAELMQVLRNYFVVNADDIDFNISITNDGYYDICLIAKSRNIKFANSFDN